MAFNIEDFRSEYGFREGVMRTNKFKVQVVPPPGLIGAAETARSLEYWCSDVQIPGYQLMTHDVRRYTYGTNEARPFAPNFEPMQLQFNSDGKGDMLDFWHNWLSYIMPHDMQKGINEGDAYMLEYKDNYVTDILVTYYKENGEKIKTIGIRSAFPININSIPLSWGDQNNHVKFTVFIDYLDWFVED